LRRTLSYLAVGGATAALYYGLIALLYGVLEIAYLIAVSVAYAGAIAFHFLANRKVTFGVRGGDAHSQVLRYAVLAATNYVVTILVVAVSVDLAGFGVYTGSTLAILANLATGYLGMKHWVFAASRTDL
jgi:putative flippase GtrA